MILDRRLNAYRADLADARLKTLVTADSYVTGALAQVSVPVAPLRPSPDVNCGIDTELLLGERVVVFERENGFAWVQSDVDQYVGYLPETMLSDRIEPTHRIIAPRTFLYSRAELRTYPIAALSMGSEVTVTATETTRGTDYFITDKGEAIIANHCVPINTYPKLDYVTIAARLLETPYLWGGRSGLGIDCSGLVQLSLAMTGVCVPRDTDMQQASIGHNIEREQLIRGDLVFWKGHVGIMEDNKILLHANGHTMSVSRENLDSAIERIGWLYERPTAYKRFLD